MKGKGGLVVGMSDNDTGDTLQVGDHVTVKTGGRILERFPDGDLLVEVDGSELLLRECEVHAEQEQ